ncbi:mandelate racemase/muconate lactonizing enzyme family protein [Halorarum halophilum]|uniref:Mandelate racemase/muconate lactonizing enzyme family protein n=1 Tax=Halorarum halophilum TaxID=2743090 RepID=A0A7D5GHU4_9EURY|nr:mandelate racemase/muconate lactonizing enzyme family protein [Halobaculum halophilum]QLG29490.1 mandelate racemase/muconate lactonizing enzyme family protein [Halobaculum halophilum]
MNAGVGWRDLSEGGRRRTESRDVEITDVECVGVAGNFPWNLIKVSTDAGEYGLGEAFTGPAGEYVEFLGPGLVGQNPFDLDRLVEHMTQLVSGLGGTKGYSQAAVSGIETALFDVVGKLTGLPVYQLLGGKYRDAVQIYADCHAGEALSGMSSSDPREMYSPEAYAEVAETVVDEGFSALKFDLDVRVDGADTATRRLSNSAIEHKVAIVEAVREAIGSDPTLGFDLHWNYGVPSASRLAGKLEPFDVAWLEDPVPPDTVAAHRRVTESTTTPILTGENLVRVEGFLPYLTEGAVDLVAPDIQKCGGLQEFRKIATLADAYNTPVAPHNISSPVGTMASVHACATVPNAFALEWHAREVDWWDDLHTGDPLIENGEIPVPESPGLGLSLDPDVLEAHLAPGEEPFEL